MNSTNYKQSRTRGLGRIMNDSWVCRLGCYHEIIENICQCECHNHLNNIMKIRKYERRLLNNV